jgi:hypothetical protein
VAVSDVRGERAMKPRAHKKRPPKLKEPRDDSSSRRAEKLAELKLQLQEVTERYAKRARRQGAKRG